MKLEARGYVSKPESATTKGGKAYSKFVLGVKQVEKAYKDKPEKVTWANFFVTDYNNSSPPPEKAYVTLDGMLKVREYEKDGIKRTALEIIAQTLEVSPPRDGGAAKPAAAGAPAEDPFGDLPF